MHLQIMSIRFALFVTGYIGNQIFRNLRRLFDPKWMKRRFFSSFLPPPLLSPYFGFSVFCYSTRMVGTISKLVCFVVIGEGNIEYFVYSSVFTHDTLYLSCFYLFHIHSRFYWILLYFSSSSL